MIKPPKESHTLYQGATWERKYRVVTDEEEIVELPGCTAKLQIREDIADEDPLISVNGVINELAGEITFTIPASASLEAEWERAVFDAELYWSGGKIDKIAIGSFKLVREVTRD